MASRRCYKLNRRFVGGAFAYSDHPGALLHHMRWHSFIPNLLLSLEKISSCLPFKFARSETDPLLDGDEIAEEVLPLRVLALRYSAALVFITAIGLMAWWMTYDNQGSDFAQPAEDGRKWWLIQGLGYSSALLFMGARVPQILKNFRTRCEGLSPALFFFAIFGNSTYALSICAKSTNRDYLIKNGGWLAGSTCTIVLDILVLCQFCYYRCSDKIKERNDTASEIIE